MNPKKIGPFLGLNNLLPSQELGTKDGYFLRGASNVDITEAGTVRRRKGFSEVVSGVACHSFWSNGKRSFYVDDDKLYELTGTFTKLHVATVTRNLKVSYDQSPTGQIFISNGVQFFRSSVQGVVEQATIVQPNTMPTLTAGTGGSLPKGMYRVVIAYERDGEEGPTTFPVSVDVPENGTITVSGLPFLANHFVSLYVTEVNGDIFYRLTRTQASSYVIPLITTSGAQPTGFMKSNIPAPQIIKFSCGRTLAAVDNILYISDPYALTLYDPSKGFIPFPEKITMVEPCGNSTGVFISADQVYWLEGEVGEATLRTVLPYKAVPGTSVNMTNEQKVMWMSERGAVIGTQDGQAVNVQEKNVAVDPAIVGASLIREQDGEKQLISTLFNSQSTVMAASSYLEAEVIRKETVL